MAARILTALVATALCAPVLTAQRPRDLSGAWVLQTDAATAAQAPTGDRPAPALERRRESDRSLRQLGLLLGMAGSVPAFTIGHDDSSITVTNADGFRYVLLPGGDEQQLVVADSVVVRHRTRWDGSFLQVEWRPEGGGKFTERYQLADSGQYLRVDISVEFERFRRSESRMYRRSDEP